MWPCVQTSSTSNLAHPRPISCQLPARAIQHGQRPIMRARQQSLAAHCHSSPEKLPEPCPKQRRCKEGRDLQDMAGTPLMGAQQQSLAAETETVLAVADGTHCHSSPQKVAEPCPKQRRCKEGRDVQDMAGNPLMRAQHQFLAAETETVLAVATGMCYHSSPEKVAEPCPKRRRCKEGSCPDGMPAGLMGKW